MALRRRSISICLCIEAMMMLTGNSLPLKGRCYLVVDNMAMFGHNEKVIRGISFDDCKRKCDTENSFFCLSVDYTDSGTCYLSNANHLTDPEGFGAHHGATYAYVTECSQSEDNDFNGLNEITEEENNGNVHSNARCYQFYDNKHLYGHDQYTVAAVDLRQCLNSCDSENSFSCLSVNYLPSGFCELIPTTHREEPELFDVFDGAVYAVVADCKSVSERSLQFGESSEDQDDDNDIITEWFSFSESSDVDESSGSLSDGYSYEYYGWP